MVSQTRRDAILKHITRYQVSLRPVLERLFYVDGRGGIDRDLKVLKEEGLLTVVPNGVPEPRDPRTKYSYYYLTRKACGLIGAPDSRARRPGGSALERSLAILWLCCMSKTRCHRLTENEVAELFAIKDRAGDFERVQEHLTGFHCLVRKDEHFKVLNIYATKANTRDTLSELKKRVDEARRVASVAQAIRDHEYAFTLLVETTERAAELRAEIAKQLGGEGFLYLVQCSPRSWQK